MGLIRMQLQARIVPRAMSIGILLIPLAALLLALACSAPAAAEPPTVHEVTMAAPDIVRVEVREAPVHPGRIIRLKEPVEAGHKGWVVLADGRRGIAIGPKRDHLRLADRAEIEFLDRKAVDRAAGYGAVGGRRVTAVYRKSVPWSSGSVYKPGDANIIPIASFAHFLYLKLDGALPPGAHAIAWPGGLLPATPFTFDDRVTRASSIRATQLGHRPGDIAKYAYLAQWLPDGPDDGALDFRRYGVSRFEIVDRAGAAVFTGDIALRVGPKDVEEGDGLNGDLFKYTRADGSAFEANRAGTFVFGLDYGAWRDAAPGTYRIRIPGLGVSDPFEIADDIWHRAAQASMAGLYHQRSGLALDGRFGYTRPECFTEASGVTVHQSRLPYALSTEGGGFVKFEEGAKAPWITDRAVPDAWGGYQDAGDWDRRIQHVSASYLLLDVFEQLPKAARRMAFDTPASGDVLPHPLYKGKDLPDIVDEAVWNLDFYRRLQRQDGAVPGGVESGNGPRRWEPSWMESSPVFVYAPDPSATHAYAAAAAKLAIVFKGLGEATLSALYAESALRAWDWAERATADTDIAFGEARAILGRDSAKVEERVKKLTTDSDNRLWAAATLYRLTGEERFNQVVINRFKTWVDMQFTRADAGWEYLNAHWPSKEEAVLKHTQRGIRIIATEFILKAHPTASYKSMKHTGAPMMWGEGGAANAHELAALIRAYRQSGDKKFISAMLDGSAHILGANQIGMSFTTGLGQRWPRAPLHEDSIAAGIPAPTGITIYGWAHPAPTSYWYIWGPSWAVLSNEVPTKRVEPFRTSLPIFEYLIEYPGIIMSAEYTVNQTISTTAALWIFLDGYDRGESGAKQ